jgi:tripartite-type tricarboxylate transporter receptor subunit TctC
MDLMAGRIDMLVGTIAPTLAQIRQGNLRAFAIMSDTRSPILPEVPTIGEAGAPGCEAALWTALVAPAGVPAAIITRLNQAVVAAVNSPEVQQSLKIQGITPEYGSSEDVAARIRADVKKWKDVADGAKINGAK